MLNTTQLKCLVVGDSGVGKTSLLSTYATRKYPTDHVPTVFDNFIVPLASHDNKKSSYNNELEMTICDTSTQDGYTFMRQTMYPTSDVILICFAINRPQTLENVTKFWIPEIRKFQGPRSAQIILVGTKCDLRNKAPHSVSLKTAEKFSKKCKAVAYIECSALNNTGLKEIFEKVGVKMLESAKLKHDKRKHSFISGVIKHIGAKFTI